MKNKSIVILSVLIVLMTGIIVAAVWYLYADSASPSLAKAETVKVESTETEAAAAPVKEAEASATEDVKATEAPATELKEADAPKADVKADEVPAASVNEFQVKNCGTGKMNTLRQNADNSLELIDNNGKQLWKKQLLGGKIVGKPAQIDIYGNNKVQFLIAEGKKLHLIDRLGRQVTHFPLDLPGTARSGPLDVKASNGIIYWKIETSASVVYFDKKSEKILNQIP